MSKEVKQIPVYTSFVSCECSSKCGIDIDDEFVLKSEYDRLKKSHEWNLTEKILPENNIQVLVVYNQSIGKTYRKVKTAYYNDTIGWQGINLFNNAKITHWKYFPELPEELL